MNPQHILTAVSVTALLVAGNISQGAELLRNGSFDNVLVDWTVAEALGNWLPYQHPAGNLSLQTDAFNYKGLLLSQPLNVPNPANQQINASVDLQALWAPSAGKSFAVRLEYLTTLGALERVTLINPDNLALPVSPLAAATFSASYTLPANAAKLVRLTIEKETTDYIAAVLDNVHLTSTTLLSAPVPHLTALTGDQVAYGGTFTINGSGFGGITAPVVLLNGSTSGLSVNSWTDTAIIVGVDVPAASGNVSVEIGGTPTVERRSLAVTSLHLFVTLPESFFNAVAGQLVGVPVQVEFRGGFAATPPGVQLQVLRNGVPFAGSFFAPGQLPRTGGTHLTMDTTGLPAGLHRFQVRVTHGAFTLNSNFEILIEVPAGIRIYQNGVYVPNPFSISTQEKISTSAKLVDANGNPLAAAPRLTWSSSNESVFKVFAGSRPWEGTTLLIKNDGNAILHITGPGGLHYQIPVNVDAPDSPRVLVCQLGVSTRDNSGPPVENTFFYQFTAALSGFSWSVSDMTGVSFGDGTWGGDGKSYMGRFTFAEGQVPGQFLISASSNGTGASDILTVVNAANKGMMTGRIASFGNSSGMHEQGMISGVIEFFDATTGILAFKRDIFEWSELYHAAYLTPGSYKVRWTPQTGSQTPQWYPLATSFAEGSVVPVTAGATVPDINFFFTTPTPPVVTPALAGPPGHNSMTGTFSLSVQTDSTGRYQLQRSNTLLEGSWFNVGAAVWGDGSAKLFQDATATGDEGFYRVLRN